jgi:hypothetical protein
MKISDNEISQNLLVDDEIGPLVLEIVSRLTKGEVQFVKQSVSRPSNSMQTAASTDLQYQTNIW